MSGVYKCLKFLSCTVVCIGFGIVGNIVAVIGIVGEVATEYIAVELLIGSCHPDGIYTEIIKIAFIELFGDTCKVTTMECSS